MPYRSEWVEPEVALEYRGVTVHTVYKDLEFDSPLTMWYAIYPRDKDRSFDWSMEGAMDESREFDIRDYARYVGMRADSVFRYNPEESNDQAVQKPDSHTEILKALIDAKILTQEGIRRPEGRISSHE